VDVPYKKDEELSKGVSTLEVAGHRVLQVEPWVLRQLAERAIHDIQHLLRPGHLAQLAKILEDPKASDNDRFAAYNLLENATIAARGTLPGCQDTGTAIVMGKKGQFVWTEGEDEKYLSAGIFDAYTKTNLRYSQVSPVSMFAEKNTKSNLPAQIDLYSKDGNSYEFFFMAKGGGSANKTYLFQQTKALLNPKSLEKFIYEKVQTIGTSACPPYHLAFVIGGTSSEMNLKTVKMASARYYDDLPTSGNDHGRAYRDIKWEEKILKMVQDLGIGAQFGGKYFAHDVRVIRLPRHGASCPVGMGVSCSADRQILAKINEQGVFVEELERNPGQFMPLVPPASLASSVVKIDLNMPMQDIRAILTKYPIKTRISLSGPVIVARDIAHAKLAEMLEADGKLPEYMMNHPVYYAGPAKTPEGYASGSFGPTTAGRMDTYVPMFQPHGASLVTLAKGNRSKQVTESCKQNGGFHIGSLGGAAAILAEKVIKKVEVVEFAELGMEAIWKIEVVDFPAFIMVDDKGNDFFAEWAM
jgi:fumarate hydratase class I